MSESKRVLLVEDDPCDVELTVKGLTECGLGNEVITVSDGVQALDYLRRQNQFHDRPDGYPSVVLLDLKLPKIDGKEVLREIKSNKSLRQIPVVVLTSSREDVDLDECYHLGVNAYIVKPMNFHDYLEAVRMVGTFWLTMNEPPKTCLQQPSLI